MRIIFDQFKKDMKILKTTKYIDDKRYEFLEWMIDYLRKNNRLVITETMYQIGKLRNTYRMAIWRRLKSLIKSNLVIEIENPNSTAKLRKYYYIPVLFSLDEESFIEIYTTYLNVSVSNPIIQTLLEKRKLIIDELNKRITKRKGRKNKPYQPRTHKRTFISRLEIPVRDFPLTKEEAKNLKIYKDIQKRLVKRTENTAKIFAKDLFEYIYAAVHPDKEKFEPKLRKRYTDLKEKWYIYDNGQYITKEPFPQGKIYSYRLNFLRHIIERRECKLKFLDQLTYFPAIYKGTVERIWSLAEDTATKKEIYKAFIRTFWKYYHAYKKKRFEINDDIKEAFEDIEKETDGFEYFLYLIFADLVIEIFYEWPKNWKNYIPDHCFSKFEKENKVKMFFDEYKEHLKKLDYCVQVPFLNYERLIELKRKLKSFRIKRSRTSRNQFNKRKNIPIKDDFATGIWIFSKTDRMLEKIWYKMKIWIKELRSQVRLNPLIRNEIKFINNLIME